MSSSTSENSFIDDEDSYKKLIRSRRSIAEDTVVDESASNYSLNSTSNSLNETSVARNVHVKKKSVKPLQSDSDSDFENDGVLADLSNSPLETQNETTNMSYIDNSESEEEDAGNKPNMSYIDNSESEEEDAGNKPNMSYIDNSESEEEDAGNKPKMSYMGNSESEEEDAGKEPNMSYIDNSESEEEDAGNKPNMSYIDNSESEEEDAGNKPKMPYMGNSESEEEDAGKEPSTEIVESDSGDDLVPLPVIESFTEKPKENMDAATDLENHHDDEVLNLSAKMKTARISNQFHFNSEGILNSTSVHTIKQVPGKWRPSNAFSLTGEILDESVEVLDNDPDIIEVSSREQSISPPKSPRKVSKAKIGIQQTLHSFVQTGTTPIRKSEPDGAHHKSSPTPLSTRQDNTESPKIFVSRGQYQAQESKVDNLEMYFVKVQSMTENVDMDALPDKGELIKDRLRIAENKYMDEKHKLDKMAISDEILDDKDNQVAGGMPNIGWDDLQAGANVVLPKTFGKQAMSTYNAQKAVTMDRLQQLHGALQTCPKEDDKEDDPKGIKVPLMPHQRRALAWLVFREKEKPSGGILADDMGLGKTLTMIALILRSKEIEKRGIDSDEENENRNPFIGKNTKYNGGSLIVCPASLINQWSGEIDRRLKRGLISYYLYHGPRRESRPRQLSEYDVVITTYAIVNIEKEQQSPLFRILWSRIVLDEAHQIRNYKSHTSEACCLLRANSRWALTGTPMHNKEMDFYALLKFLRCTPFDDIQVWKRWICDKSGGGQERLHTVISSLMLRRTKLELIEKGALTFIPEKRWLLVKVELEKSEMQVYHKVLIFSQTLFAQFLHQRAEKNQAYVDHNLPGNSSNAEYFKVREKLLKLNKVKNVSQHEILVLLLRLRQICCHPSLITAMLEEGLQDVEEGNGECEELNILEQLQKLNIEDEQEDEYKPGNAATTTGNKEVRVNLKEATRGHLRPSDPVFAKERISSKISKMLEVLKAEVLEKNDKAIIVSQWSSYLNLIAIHLKKYGVEFLQLDGKVPVHKRMQMVDRLNDPNDSLRILLLSLTAGGVGLNLVGANHLFLLDLHWNPQLESQAQDRIYRVGQIKPVFVYKFMAIDTIEERIKLLQEKKLAIAEGILTGTRQVVENKLSIEELRLIFQM